MGDNPPKMKIMYYILGDIRSCTQYSDIYCKYKGKFVLPSICIMIILFLKVSIVKVDGGSWFGVSNMLIEYEHN